MAVPRYSLWEAVQTALQLGMRALEETRLLAQRALPPQGEPGPPGAPGKGFRIRGTYLESGDYQANDIVMLSGSSFVALKDDPGACPGDGWQLWASAGRRGKNGEDGLRGIPGERGAPGAAIIGGKFDTKTMKLILVRDDGATVDVDAYEFAETIRRAG